MEKQISVLITCHPPCEKYLEECVHSVKAQTHKPYEVIIVLDSYEKPMLFKGVTTIVRNNNKGVAISRDEVFKLSTGTHILFLDADDAIPENFLEEMIKVDADIVYPDVLLWNYWSEKPLPNVMHYSPKKITEQGMLRHNRVVVTSLMKRDVYEAIGGFDSNLPMFEDYYYFLKAIKKKFTFKKANTFMKYRQRTQSRNHQEDDLKRKVYDDIMERYAKI